jgi:TrpR family transcriptional regulator, trp operon repressor
MDDFKEFVNLIFSIDDKETLEDLLVSVTTPKERNELSKRIHIIKLLIEGKAQHDIATKLGVGIATVSRGSKELALGNFKIFKNKQNYYE